MFPLSLRMPACYSFSLKQLGDLALIVVQFHFSVQLASLDFYKELWSNIKLLISQGCFSVISMLCPKVCVLCVSCPHLMLTWMLSFLCLHCFCSAAFWSHFQKSVLIVESESGRAPGYLGEFPVARFFEPFQVLQHTRCTNLH